MRISILIPAHNEERSIRATVESCLTQTRPADEILVVNDGSTDRTGEILSKFGTKIHVITIPVATGNKSYAQEYGLRFITGDVFIATDGDTILDRHFVEKIEPHFDDPEVTAVGGYIQSIKNNWLTACREIDYAFGQNLHKRAQDNIGYLFVIPGCAGAFRTDIFRKIATFDHDTITEDLDFTYKFHKNNCKIIFERGAIVYTQDPFTFNAYINQMRRWYSGGWQNLLKHVSGILHRPSSAFELSLMYIEGTIFSTLIFIVPFLNPEYFFKVYLGMYFTFTFLVASYAGWIRRRLDLVLVAPLYPLLSFTNAYIFIEQFVKEVIFRKRMLVWFKPERQLSLEN